MFLHDMYKNGCLQSRIYAAGSALSRVVKNEGYDKLSSNTLITRFVKATFNRHPPLSKYANIWGINALLTHYDNIPLNIEILQLRAKFQTAIVSRSRFIWITNSSDHRNYPALWPSGFGNDFVCKRYTVQTIPWSLESVIQINLEYDTIAIPLNSKLDFECLCKKLVIFFLILGAKRKQALTSITVENVIHDYDKVTLLPNKTLKHSALNRPLKRFVYHFFMLLI